MYSIEVTEDWNERKKASTVSITLKTLYSIKLYSDLIDLDIPRTFRNIYQFRFKLNYKSQVYREHWGWLVQAIISKSTYWIKFSYKKKMSIQVKDNALIFTMELRHLGESRHYAPLEYHRDDAIEMCRQIQSIYDRRNIQFHRRDTLSLDIPPNLLSIPPNQFPIVSVRRSGHGTTRINCFTDHFTACSFVIMQSVERQLCSWLQAITPNQSHNDLIFNDRNLFENVTLQAHGNGEIRVSDTYSSWKFPYSTIPKIIAALA
jgi:hypothetical protein